MTTEWKILMWWVLFGGSHIVLSSMPVRTVLIRRLGLMGFKGVYSLVALATFVPLCWVYFTDKHAGVMLFETGFALQYVAQALMLLAFVVLFQAYTYPSPMSSDSEMKGKYSDNPRGIQRITRHPQNLAFALFGVAHCLALPFAGDQLFFGGFVLYAVVSAVHQDRRTRAGGPDEVRRFQDATSIIPFMAIVRGKQRLALGELKLGALIAAVVVFFVLRYFHGSWLGGFGN